MGELEGRRAIITGAGRGIGREHALFFAAEGASVVVNDLAPAGGGLSPAETVVAEITAAGGIAVANHDDITDPAGAQRLVALAVASFGGLDVLVNNAGILRDRTVVNMTDEEWDDVLRVNLRGHVMPIRAAANHWRTEHKAGRATSASIVNTTSTSGLMSNPGQANYGAAKSGVATLTEICAKELGRYGVRCNAIAPAARTRLTLGAPGGAARYAAEAAASSNGWVPSDPGNISPFVGYLATRDCPLDGKVFFVYGNKVHLFQPWTIIDHIGTEQRWSISGLRAAAGKWADVTFDYRIPMD